jgi:hypothetical protein
MYTVKEPKLIAASRKTRLCWDEHLKHVEEEQMPKKLMYSKISGKRNVEDKIKVVLLS